jgi:diguanylate cyclase (GGDEF)-like protein
MSDLAAWNGSMRLDAPTLLVVTVILTFMVGILFLLSWSQARQMRALAIWGVAHLVGGVGSALLSLRGLIPGPLSIGVANALITGAYGLIWMGTRAFEGRSLRPWTVAACVGLWCGACLVPDFYTSMAARIVLASSLAGGFCFATAALIWRGRSEPLVSRYPATILLVVYGLMYATRVPMAILDGAALGNVTLLPTPAFAILACLGMVLTVALAFVLMALTKERAEHLQRRAATVDSLTGIANRRAFVAQAEAVLNQRPPNAALLLFDLDHFKRVNDSHGHAVGDAVLVAFCQTAGGLMPPGTIFGRMGGEEFASLFMDIADAPARADLIRRAVAHLTIPGAPDLRISVSIGLTMTQACGHGLDALMRTADAALYTAKRNGRNRVECAPSGPATPRPVAALLDADHHGVRSAQGVHHRDPGEAGPLGTPHGLAPSPARHGQAIDHPGEGWHAAKRLEGENRIRRAVR